MKDKLILDNELLFGDVVRLLGEGRRVTIPVKGSSMLPLIRGERDLVTLEPVCATAPITQARPLDIVLFRFQERYILHRILRWEGDTAIIQGDGILKNKEHCKADSIYGRVCEILRDGVAKGADGARRADPRTRAARLGARGWLLLRPVRRWLLAAWRRLPGNRNL